MTDTMTRRAMIAAGAAAGAVVATAAEAQGRYPEMDRALGALQSARNDLAKAQHKFGGHREAAVKACDEAIRQIRDGIGFANSHK